MARNRNTDKAERMTAEAAAWAGVFLVVAGMLASIIAWVFRTSLKPLKIVIENNTAAMNLVSETIAKHGDSISDHEGRLIEIETTHEVLNCKRRRGDNT